MMTDTEWILLAALSEVAPRCINCVGFATWNNASQSAPLHTCDSCKQEVTRAYPMIPLSKSAALTAAVKVLQEER